MIDKRSHFRFTKSQKNGIFFILLILILIQVAYVNVDFSKDALLGEQNIEVASFIKEVDSLKEIALHKSIPKIYPFNPSFISDYKGEQLGLSIQEIDKLLKHQIKGKYINSPKHFQQVSGVSDSLLNKLQPYFKFPDWIIKNQGLRKSRTLKKNNANGVLGVRDINTATYSELMLVDGVSESLAKRIVNYRNKLIKYSVNDQLYEVWYLKRPLANKILKNFKVLSPVEIKKININTASFKEILKIVYLDYELTKKIMNYRDEIAEYQSLEELKNIPGFPIDRFNRIILYLEAK